MPVQPRKALMRLARRCLGPVGILFLSAHVVTLGNLAFNVVFSRWMGPAHYGELATLLTLFLAITGVLAALQLSVTHESRGRMIAASNPDSRACPATG